MRRIAGRMRIVTYVLVLVMSWVSAAVAQSVASDFYLAYRKAFEAASAIEDVLPFLSASARQQVEATPVGDRPQMFEFMKMIGARHDIKIVGEEPSGDDGIVLTVEATAGDGGHTHGTITLVREAGSLKLSQERWTAGEHPR